MPQNVLLVDDSKTVRQVLRKILGMTTLDFALIAEASNGIEAYDELRQQRFDLLFLDLHMPEMGGITLLEKLRDERKLEHLNIIVLTSDGAADRIDYVKSFNVKGYLRKPVTPETVEATISGLLGEK